MTGIIYKIFIIIYVAQLTICTDKIAVAADILPWTFFRQDIVAAYKFATYKLNCILYILTITIVGLLATFVS